MDNYDVKVANCLDYEDNKYALKNCFITFNRFLMVLLDS